MARLAAEPCELLIRIFLIREPDHIILRGYNPVPACVPVKGAVFRTGPSCIAAGCGAPRFTVRTTSAGRDRAAEPDTLSGMKTIRIFSRADNPPDDFLHKTALPVPRIRTHSCLKHFNLNVFVSHSFCGVLRRGKDGAGRGSVSRRAEQQRRKTRADNTGKSQQMFFHNVAAPF